MAEHGTAATRTMAAQDQESTVELTLEELEARRAWYRQYRAKNPAKVAQWEKNRWHKKAQQQKQTGTDKRHRMQQGAGT